MPAARLDRVGLALAATGVMSAAIEAQYLAPPAADLGAFLGFGLGLALAVLAAMDRPPRRAVSFAFGGTLALFGALAVQLHADPLRSAGIVVCAALVYRYSDLRPLALAAFALWTPAYHFIAPRAGTLPAAVGIAALAAGLIAAVMLVERTADREERIRRALFAICAIAAAAVVSDRHLVVASSGLAPDDLSVLLLVALVPACALVRFRPTGREAAVAALTLATLVLAGVAHIVGAPYHTDAVVAPHHAADLLIAGAHPYAAFDLQAALAKFGLPRELGTHLVSGAELRSLSYPAASFLLVAPFVAAGLTDIRWVYLGVLVAMAGVLMVRGRLPWTIPAAALAGSALISRQHVLAGIDPSWALLVLVAWTFARHRWLSAVALGLAVASRQPAWLVAPFYLGAVWRTEGRAEALSRAATATAVAAVLQLPFLVTAPEPYVMGVLAPVLEPLEPSGVGLARLAAAGLVPLLPRAAYAVLAIGCMGLLLAVVWRRWPGSRGPARVLALLPLFVAWRSLASYFSFAPLLALAPQDGEVRERHRSQPSGR